MPAWRRDEYVVQVQTTDFTGSRGVVRGGFQQIGGFEFALVPLTVKSANIDGIRVVTSRGSHGDRPHCL